MANTDDMNYKGLTLNTLLEVRAAQKMMIDERKAEIRHLLKELGVKTSDSDILFHLFTRLSLAEARLDRTEDELAVHPDIQWY